MTHIADIAAYAPADDTAATLGSRFERIVAHSAALGPDRGDVLGLLLAAACAPTGGGRPCLMPLWGEEAMHRAYAMLRLLARQAERDRHCPPNSFTAGAECALARGLATTYRSLDLAAEDEIVPCSAPLRDIALNMGTLFGGGEIVVRTAIERASLPAYKRRALVLCASELMVNAFTHAFDAGARGRIDVSLRLFDRNLACLRVADNGGGFRGRPPDPARSVAGGLAELVEADLTYRRNARGITTAEIVFPLAAPHGTGKTVTALF